MKTEEYLGEMLKLLDNGKRWTRGAMFRGPNGKQCGEPHEAKRFCLHGANLYLQAERGIFLNEGQEDVITRMRRVIGGKVLSFNDRAKNFGEIKAMLIAAMEDGK